MNSRYDKNDVEDTYSDCFAKTTYMCTALTEKLCKNGGKCNFYKSKELYEKQVKVLPDNYVPKNIK